MQLARYVVSGCAVLSVALVAGLFLSGHETVFMNGRVSQIHASIEGRCRSCHQPWAGVSVDRCLVCHGPVVREANHSTTAQPCTACHHEHRGRSATLIRPENRQCMGCHTDVLGEGRHPAETSQQCLLCHGQHAPDTFARTVQSDLLMSHQTHLKATGLVQASCETCHQPAPDPARMQLPPETVCQSCHFGYTHDKTKDLRSKECLACHAADQRVTLQRRRGFASLRFSHATHQAFACQECHAEVAMTTSLAEITLPGVVTCMKCH